MSNDKSGRKKLARMLTTIIAIIVLVMGSLYGINEIGLIPNNETTATQPESTTLIQGVQGELVVHMIDQTTPNMIQGLKGIFARKPLISIGI